MAGDGRRAASAATAAIGSAGACQQLERRRLASSRRGAARAAGAEHHPARVGLPLAAKAVGLHRKRGAGELPGPRRLGAQPRAVRQACGGGGDFRRRGGAVSSGDEAAGAASFEVNSAKVLGALLGLGAAAGGRGEGAVAASAGGAPAQGKLRGQLGQCMSARGSMDDSNCLQVHEAAAALPPRLPPAGGDSGGSGRWAWLARWAPEALQFAFMMPRINY